MVPIVPQSAPMVSVADVSVKLYLKCMVLNPQYSLQYSINFSCCFWVYCCSPELCTNFIVLASVRWSILVCFCLASNSQKLI